MNIFYVHSDPVICAQQHVDKHVVKMILEYAQLMSTAHRILDGVETVGLSKSGRKAKRWVLPDEREDALYKASHINHPSAKWCRHSLANYQFLFKLWIELMREYHYRYGKSIHQCDLGNIYVSHQLISLPLNNSLLHGVQCQMITK